MKTRSMIKKKVADAVLDEQDYQFDNDLCNDITIREAAIHISKISTERALSLAQLDAEYVRDTITYPSTTTIANNNTGSENTKKINAQTKITNMRRVALTQEPCITIAA